MLLIFCLWMHLNAMMHPFESLKSTLLLQLQICIIRQTRGIMTPNLLTALSKCSDSQLGKPFGALEQPMPIYMPPVVYPLMSIVHTFPLLVCMHRWTSVNFIGVCILITGNIWRYNHFHLCRILQICWLNINSSRLSRMNSCQHNARMMWGFMSDLVGITAERTDYGVMCFQFKPDYHLVFILLPNLLLRSGSKYEWEGMERLGSKRYSLT